MVSIYSNDYTLFETIRFVKYFNDQRDSSIAHSKRSRKYSRLEIGPTTIDCMTRVIHADHLRVVSYRSCIFRNVFRHNAARTDSGIIANFDMLNDANIRPNINIVTNFCCLTAAIGANRCKLR